jgi:hypothetical protein
MYLSTSIREFTDALQLEDPRAQICLNAIPAEPWYKFLPDLKMGITQMYRNHVEIGSIMFYRG